MPFITDTAMQKVATKLQSFETREEKRKIEVRQKLNEAKTVAESSLGAALVGSCTGGSRMRTRIFSFRARAFRRILRWRSRVWGSRFSTCLGAPTRTC